MDIVLPQQKNLIIDEKIFYESKNVSVTQSRLLLETKLMLWEIFHPLKLEYLNQAQHFK